MTVLDFLVADAVERVGEACGRHRAEFLDQRAGVLGQIEVIRPPVGRVGAPLDQAGGLHAVDLAAERDRLHIHLVGEASPG